MRRRSRYFVLLLCVEILLLLFPIIVSTQLFSYPSCKSHILACFCVDRKLIMFMKFSNSTVLLAACFEE